MRPLEGLAILDFSRVLSGPFCTMMLADLGAEVIKIEDVQGKDVTRHNHPFVGGESHYFLAVNRNKSSLALDLRSDAGLTIARELAGRADVVIDNFRPGVMKQLGLDRDTLRRSRPEIICCSLSAFGQTGPWRDKVAYDLVIQALTGGMAVTGEPNRPPVRMGLPLADEVSGLFAAIAILAALEQRDRTGNGCELDIAMFDSGLALLSYMANIYFAVGASPERLGSAHPTIYPYNAFKTSDGYIVAAPFTQAFWRKFATVLGRPDLPSEPRFRNFLDRQRNRSELEGILDPILLGRTSEEWLRRLDGGDVPNGAVNAVGVALEMEQTRARGMVVEVDHPTAGKLRTLGTPFHITFGDGNAFVPTYRAAPMLGEDSSDILSLLGYGSDEIEALVRAQVTKLSSAGTKTRRRSPIFRATRAPRESQRSTSTPIAATSDAPLSDIRVLDLTRMLAGPMAGLILADLGAEVIKVEEPGVGDPTRRNLPFVGNESAYYMSVNRGKQSVTLDLKTNEGRRIFLDLVSKSDVVIENYRAGVLDRLGLGYSELKRVKPDVILGSISGFGATGPLRDKISFDLVNQAIAGVMAVTGEADRPPCRLGVPAGDLCGGIFCALAILAALRARRASGLGAHIDLGLHDSLVSLLGYIAQYYFVTGESPAPVGSGHHHIVPYRAYKAVDGYFVVAAFSQGFWQKLARALGCEELTEDSRFKTLSDRKSNRELLEAILEPIFLGRPVDYWIELLERNDVPCARIASVGEALFSPQATARNMVFDVEHSVLGRQRALGMPFRCDDRVWRSVAAPPTLGQHTAVVLQRVLGYSASEIERVMAGEAVLGRRRDVDPDMA
jgi:crotonobetainyl-CoA:carnitine CoA-transferase CaiB-like acyl-CoA transferase